MRKMEIKLIGKTYRNTVIGFLLAALLLTLPLAIAAQSEKIAFHRNLNFSTDIYVMNPDGSSPANLTNNGARNENPAFSPDGSKIVFESDRIISGFYDIYVMDAVPNAPQTNLTMSSRDETTPTFSPDGSQIAFASRDSDGDWEIYVMNADGSGQTRLTINAAGDYAPSRGIIG